MILSQAGGGAHLHFVEPSFWRKGIVDRNYQ